MKIKLIILMLCLFFTLPARAISNTNTGIGIGRTDFCVLLSPLYRSKSLTAYISGINDNDTYIVSKINNKRVSAFWSSNNYIENLINGENLYVFSLILGGDIFVYDYFCDTLYFVNAFAKYLNNNPEVFLDEDTLHSKIQINKNETIDYNKYFNIDYDKFTISDKNLTDEEKKEYKKSNKDLYKKVTQIQKYLEKSRFVDSMEVDKDFLPIYLFMYQQSLQDGTYGNTLYALTRMKELNTNMHIFNDNTINYKLGLVYLIFAQYDKALEYLKEFANYAPQTEEQYLSHALMLSHFYLGNYSTAIFYANQIKNDSNFYVETLRIMSASYRKLNNTAKEKEYIAKLLKIKPSVELYLRYADLCTNKNEKLDLYYKARNLSNDDSTNINALIIKLEQEKIDNSTKNLQTFVEVPNWNKYYSSLRSISYSYNVYNLQDEFFKKANNCINRYRNTNLAKCYASIIKEYDDMVQLQQNEYNLQMQQRMQNDYIRELERIRYNMQKL